MPEHRQAGSQVPHSVTGSLQQPYQVTVSYRLADGAKAAPEPEDAETYCRRAAALREQKRFHEALAAFDRAIALKPDYAQGHNGRGIVCANLDRPAEALAAFDRAIVLKPDYAEAHNNRGIVLQELIRCDEALASFDRTIALQPANAQAHNNRGTTLYALRRLEDALASQDKAIALKPDYAEAYYNRAVVLHDLKRFEDALADFDRAINLKPDYAAAYNNRGALLQDLKRLDEALASFARAIACAGPFPEAYVNQSYCLLQMGRFEEGWRLHEWRKQTEIPVGNRQFPQPLWLGAPDLTDKTIFLHWEQGIGDTIQFCRYGAVLQARRAKVAMSVQEPLFRLLRQADAGMEILRGDEVPAAFDYHCPLMSLPLALGTTLATIPGTRPYLFADRHLSEAWDARLPPRSKPRIGIVWSGNAKQKNNRNRSMALAALAPLLSADAHWISLQKELADGDAGLLAKFPQLIHYGDALTDFAETAAIIDRLDLLISVDTSVAHLAGAMGKPAWIFLAYNCDWRWLCDRTDSPWYPSVRLFRQQEPDRWASVVARVKAALADRYRPA